MANVLYDKQGGTHVINTMWYGGNYFVYIDGRHYATADTRSEAEEVESDYIKEHELSAVRPKKKRKKILRSRLQANSGVSMAKDKP